MTLFHGWGHLYLFIRKKIEVLNEYIDHENLQVKNWVRDIIDRIQQQIGRENKEKEEEHGIYN